VKVLLLNQCFWPDVVATAQQLTTLARGLRAAGHDVTVIASRSGYDDSSRRFPRRERWKGIEIVRVPSLDLGKKTRWRRALNFGSFLITGAGRLLLTPRHDVIVALTSPPLISWLAAMFTRLRGGRMIFWSMDLNPDEAIAAGWLRKDSFTARFLARLLATSMTQATRIIALDRFMKDRMIAKGIAPEKIEVIPPAADESVHYYEEGREAFRRRHGIAEKFVVMYAGNHSPCNPLDTLLDAAKILQRREDILFLFVGGGSGLDQIKEQSVQLPNIRWLPYQPQGELAAALSAADLHGVVLGDGFSGIIHPSKIYNIIAVGSPFVFIGPMNSFIGDMIANKDAELVGQARHGEAACLAHLIAKAADQRSPEQSRTKKAVPIRDTVSRLVALIEATGAAAAPGFEIETARASATQV
jgi:colanic acid biosynthesis glycosyl transferase WcaI